MFDTMFIIVFIAYSYSFLANTDLVGTNINDGDFISIQQCQAKCDSDVNCKAFLVTHFITRCWLKYRSPFDSEISTTAFASTGFDSYVKLNGNILYLHCKP